MHYNSESFDMLVLPTAYYVSKYVRLTEQSKTDQNRAEQVRSEQNRTKQNE